MSCRVALQRMAARLSCRPRVCRLGAAAPALRPRRAARGLRPHPNVLERRAELIVLLALPEPS